jgi:Predicted membrane protein
MDLKAKNKIIANLFLLFAFLIFLASYLIHVDNIWIFILQRASAAALIGGIADWFAVRLYLNIRSDFIFRTQIPLKTTKKKLLIR